MICVIERSALVQGGLALMRGGYRKFLRHGLRDEWPFRSGVSKTTPSKFGIPSENLLLHDDRTHAGAAMRGALSSWSSQMPDPMAGLPPRFLRTPEAARYLGLSGRTLEKHRTYGTGPTYRKIGGRVVYAVDDLKAWADLGAKTSTSDPGKGTVLPAKKHPVLRPYAGQERR
ncbi:putative DNA-binding transcriptional regulator AlpA [Bradyrhizobium sp. CIR3A]|nr:putative DNA-binding transcriptional regulator AlpA [Bradyrhizobium sp. CIR3A]